MNTAEPEIRHTPKHGSWLIMAEIELSTLGWHCLDGRIPGKKMMGNGVYLDKQTEQDRAARHLAIHRQRCANPTTRTQSVN